MPTDATGRYFNPEQPMWEGFNLKIVEFLMGDGEIRRGEFVLEDSASDGEWSMPIWHVKFADGSELPFYDERKTIKGWRRIEAAV